MDMAEVVLVRALRELELERVFDDCVFGTLFFGGWYLVERFVGGATTGPFGAGLVDEVASNSSFFLSKGVLKDNF